ncbi:hypothetical protein HZC00_00420 [Candidatus Kaiserbacteria bacterium]|nr:hypothetical protein [Candidatus Kaiserbacteria bacterium]
MNKFNRFFVSGTTAFLLAVAPGISFALPITSLNGQTGTTQTFATSTGLSAMHMKIVSTSNVHTFSWDSTPWTIAQGGTGATSFTEGSIPFIWGGVFAQANGQLYWNNTDNILSIGGTATTAKVNIKGSGSLDLFNVATSGGSPALYVKSSGSVGIGNSNPQHALDVSGAIYSRLVTATSSTINWNDGNVQSMTLTSNMTLSFSNGQQGGEYKLILKQDSTGGRTVTWPADVLWANATAPTLTATTGGKDLISFVKDGDGFYLGSYKLNYATSSSFAVEYLVVAGGGGGGYGAGGGGGAGGMLTGAYSVTGGSTYTVTVGAGGNGQDSSGAATGLAGGNSVFDIITAIGGGNGADGFNTNTIGGSGGGGNNGHISGAAGTAGQGSTGGDGRMGSGGAGSGDGFNTGGGGGASVVGGDSTSSASGDGGAGTASSISGSAIVYAGGGGGGLDSFRVTTGNGGAGGSGGGGAGGGNTTTAGTSGTANTGGGGGGASNTGTSSGGNGGSGIVIIRYPTGTVSATGGTVTTSGGYTIHTFTSSGTFTVSS